MCSVVIISPCEQLQRIERLTQGFPHLALSKHPVLALDNRIEPEDE